MKKNYEESKKVRDCYKLEGRREKSIIIPGDIKATLHDAEIIDTRYQAFVESLRMYNRKSDPSVHYGFRVMTVPLYVPLLHHRYQPL